MLLTRGVVLRAYATQSEQDRGINRCIDRRASCLLKHPMRTCIAQIFQLSRLHSSIQPLRSEELAGRLI